MPTITCPFRLACQQGASHVLHACSHAPCVHAWNATLVHYACPQLKASMLEGQASEQAASARRRIEEQTSCLKGEAAMAR